MVRGSGSPTSTFPTYRVSASGCGVHSMTLPTRISKRDNSVNGASDSASDESDSGSVVVATGVVNETTSSKNSPMIRAPYKEPGRRPANFTWVWATVRRDRKTAP